MKQATMTLQAIERSSQIIFWSMATCLVILASMYIYFVNKTVWNVVARQQTLTQIASINSDLSSTELKYINAKAAVTIQLAESLGFKSADKQTLFVTREAGSPNVAFR